MDGVATRVNGSMLPASQGQVVCLAGRVVAGAGSGELTLEVSVRLFSGLGAITRFFEQIKRSLVSHSIIAFASLRCVHLADHIKLQDKTIVKVSGCPGIDVDA